MPGGALGGVGTQVPLGPGTSGAGHMDGGGCVQVPLGPACTRGSAHKIVSPVDGSIVGGGTQVPSGASASGNWQTGGVIGK